LEEIADRAYAIVLDSIGACLAGGSHLSVDNRGIRDGGLPMSRAFDGEATAL
jgi:hypothetical protein